LTKWGSVLIGVGSFFILVGWITLNDRSAPTWTGVMAPALPEGYAQIFPAIMRAVQFSDYFYGSLMFAIGALMLLIQYARNRNVKGTTSLKNSNFRKSREITRQD
jgi:hypothetical protein